MVQLMRVILTYKEGNYITYKPHVDLLEYTIMKRKFKLWW